MERVILPLVEEQDQMGERDLFYSFFVLGRFKSDRSRWLGRRLRLPPLPCCLYRVTSKEPSKSAVELPPTQTLNCPGSYP